MRLEGLGFKAGGGVGRANVPKSENKILHNLCNSVNISKDLKVF